MVAAIQSSISKTKVRAAPRGMRQTWFNQMDNSDLCSAAPPLTLGGGLQDYIVQVVRFRHLSSCWENKVKMNVQNHLLQLFFNCARHIPKTAKCVMNYNRRHTVWYCSHTKKRSEIAFDPVQLGLLSAAWLFTQYEIVHFCKKTWRDCQVSVMATHSFTNS